VEQKLFTPLKNGQDLSASGSSMPQLKYDG